MMDELKIRFGTMMAEYNREKITIGRGERVCVLI
jgi:hypothetical protein